MRIRPDRPLSKLQIFILACARQFSSPFRPSTVVATYPPYKERKNINAARAAVSRTLSSLAARGFVRLLAGADRARTVLVEFTPAGRTAVLLRPTQAELAKKFGVSQPTCSRWEKKDREKKLINRNIHEYRPVNYGITAPLKNKFAPGLKREQRCSDRLRPS